VKQPEWLIDETRPLGPDDRSRLDREFRTRQGFHHPQPDLALSLHDVVIHDNRKWFGDADIRLDMLVTTGRAIGEDDPSFFVPNTFPFHGVRDGDTLPIGPGGLIGFYGQPAHFLDVSILVSRDRHDVDPLPILLKDAGSGEITDAIGKLTELVAAPQVAAVETAVSAAVALSSATYRLLDALTGATIGLYRNAHLRYRDGFGIGRHPDEGSYRKKDLSFYYEIALEM